MQIPWREDTLRELKGGSKQLLAILDRRSGLLQKGSPGGPRTIGTASRRPFAGTRAQSSFPISYKSLPPYCIEPFMGVLFARHARCCWFPGSAEDRQG